MMSPSHIQPGQLMEISAEPFFHHIQRHLQRIRILLTQGVKMQAVDPRKASLIKL